MASRPRWWRSAEKEIDGVITHFIERRKEKFDELSKKPIRLLRRKNLFLLRMRGIDKVDDFARSMVDAWLSASEETRFGSIFEGCAEIVCKRGRGGQKSSTEGIDLEYSEGSTKRVLVQVKSGKNWGNSAQKKQLDLNFKRASKTLKENGRIKDVRCIEGISYGKSERKELGHHERIVGEPFWEEISGWNGFYPELLGKIGKHASNRQQDQRAKNKAVKEVVAFMRSNKLIKGKNKVDWEELLAFLSES